MNFTTMRQQDIAKALGHAVKTVARWTKSGMPRNADNTYSLPECVRWLEDQARWREQKRCLGIDTREIDELLSGFALPKLPEIKP